MTLQSWVSRHERKTCLSWESKSKTERPRRDLSAQALELSNWFEDEPQQTSSNCWRGRRKLISVGRSVSHGGRWRPATKLGQAGKGNGSGSKGRRRREGAYMAGCQRVVLSDPKRLNDIVQADVTHRGPPTGVEAIEAQLDRPGFRTGTIANDNRGRIAKTGVTRS